MRLAIITRKTSTKVRIYFERLGEWKKAEVSTAILSQFRFVIE